ncbi:hypothetical protein C8R34_12735 [Nitrosomonas sp. Nm84]|uniref:hypothetical protein n=1 Tax=Nitrosomonas sp. Nm84 TaxID=200124 RepID=UPI000D770ABE|nr:hypothetical protein [Nitrosomonas sp. Nm84]PXW83512.1 hypothetical protein C8R34_12735 [Nitrosomonas sp. Nm84]
MRTQLNTKNDPLKDIMNPFTLDEAVSLIYRLAVLKKDALQPGKKYSITQIGHICGVLTLNDQIEIVIKFHDEMRQFTKEEFYAQVKLLDE